MCICNKPRDAESYLCLCKLKCLDFQFWGFHIFGGTTKEIITQLPFLGKYNVENDCVTKVNFIGVHIYASPKHTFRR